MSNKAPLGDYARYSGLAIQMGLIIGVFTWLGIWIDEQMAWQSVATVIGALLGVGVALYLVLKNLA
jgi:uncharacterized membrane protein